MPLSRYRRQRSVSVLGSESFERSLVLELIDFEVQTEEDGAAGSDRRFVGSLIESPSSAVD